MNSPQTKDSNSASVLVIDDEQSVRDFFIDTFTEMGIRVDTAENGLKGLDMVYKKNYNLIFLDIVLGDVDGLEILKSIKLIDSQAGIIVVSGYLTEDIIEQAICTGADGYLYKPLSVRDIMSLTLKYI